VLGYGAKKAQKPAAQILRFFEGYCPKKARFAPQVFLVNA
jgi:hypothetical protein